MLYNHSFSLVITGSIDEVRKKIDLKEIDLNFEAFKQRIMLTFDWLIMLTGYVMDLVTAFQMITELSGGLQKKNVTEGIS